VSKRWATIRVAIRGRIARRRRASAVDRGRAYDSGAAGSVGRDDGGAASVARDEVRDELLAEEGPAPAPPRE